VLLASGFWFVCGCSAVLMLYCVGFCCCLRLGGLGSGAVWVVFNLLGWSYCFFLFFVSVWSLGAVLGSFSLVFAACPLVSSLVLLVLWL
jgi:hypothetical protein